MVAQGERDNTLLTSSRTKSGSIPISSLGMNAERESIRETAVEFGAGDWEGEEELRWAIGGD
jgi:hypothetical protein